MRIGVSEKYIGVANPNGPFFLRNRETGETHKPSLAYMGSTYSNTPFSATDVLMYDDKFVVTGKAV